LLIEVLNIAEEFFINKDRVERDTQKKECVIDLMLPYFNNDKQLLLKTIQLVDHKIKKVGLSRRLYLRAKIFFCKKEDVVAIKNSCFRNLIN
jgi:hypothetical protein